jgi:hypothetical protein
MQQQVAQQLNNQYLTLPLLKDKLHNATLHTYFCSFLTFLLQLADWYSTYIVIKKGGYEQNPIMAEFFKRLGINTTLAIKTAMVTYLGLLIGQLNLLILLGLVIFYIFVIIHNWKSL